jgi:hypothetical protein
MGQVEGEALADRRVGVLCPVDDLVRERVLRWSSDHPALVLGEDKPELVDDVVAL